MCASFELFYRFVQDYVLKKCLSGPQKAEVTDLFWKRFDNSVKEYFKRKAKQFNETHGLTGRRKITPFWFFAVLLMKHLQQKDSIDSLFLDALHTSLNQETDEMFHNLDRVTSLKRHVTFVNLMRCETSLRLY